MKNRPLAPCWIAQAAIFLIANQACVAVAQMAPATRVIEINTATEADLDSLRGLGPAHTRRILAARQDGAFASWADLQRRVRGMGPTQARLLCEQGLRVAGSDQACAVAP